MKSRTLLAALALMLLSAQALAADTKGPLVTDPDWDRQPSAVDISRYFPDKAAKAGLSGKALIACRITVTGFLENCRLMDESPVGEDFGRAALRMAEKRLFHMKPMSLLGRPVDGQIVFIPVFFVSPEPKNGPRLDFYPGDNAVMLTPDDSGSVRCPTAAAPAQMCRPHIVTWVERPAFEEIRAASGPLQGVSQLSCQVQADGRLADCKLLGVSTPAALATATAISQGLLAPPKADDGMATAGARMVVTLDWNRLTQKMIAYDAAMTGR